MYEKNRKECQNLFKMLTREHVKTYFWKEIPFIYLMNLNQVELPQDKASSHTSRSTALFLEKMCNETRIKTIPFDHIPVKSSDASPMDFCAFGL